MTPPITRISAERALANKQFFHTVIDVRSPTEFADDHVPGAINLPVLHDQERASVGNLYKSVDPFIAKRTGAMLVTRNISMHLQNVLQDKDRNWQPLIYCWRGGQRSSAMAQVFSNIGWHCSIIDGGYKAYRRHVIDYLDILSSNLHLIILSGQTGTAKTHILRAASKKGAQIIDLEMLACHRGSLLGSEPDMSQPPQRLFESMLCKVLKDYDLKQKIYIEAESNKIGNIHVPQGLWRAMRSAARIRVTASMSARVNFLQRDYAHLTQKPEMIMPLLSKLKHRHSNEQLAKWKDLIDQQDWHNFIENLLNLHYDPSYQQSGSAGQPYEIDKIAATTLCDKDIDDLASLVLTKTKNISNRDP